MPRALLPTLENVYSDTPFDLLAPRYHPQRCDKTVLLLQQIRHAISARHLCGVACSAGRVRCRRTGKRLVVRRATYASQMHLQSTTPYASFSVQKARGTILF